jgi:hypothetical protein
MFPKDALMHFGDRDGVDRACVVIFVRRDFGYTWVREHYFGWVGEKYANSSLQIPSLRTLHQRLDVKHSSYPPRPESGGRFEKAGDCFWLYVYFDDLVLNRKSGEFSIRKPLGSPTLLHTDAEVRTIVDQRRHAPEFYIE